MTTTTKLRAFSSRSLMVAMMLGGSSMAMAQSAPIVQPGAPGQASKTLSADEATELAATVPDSIPPTCPAVGAAEAEPAASSLDPRET